VIEPISKAHDRKTFDCGDEEVTRFLRKQALQNHEKNLSRTMVPFNEGGDPARIVGYRMPVMRR